MTKKTAFLRALFALLACLSGLAHAGEWIADANQCQVWNPFPAPGETVVWSGECKNGRISGPGSLTWSRNGRFSSREDGNFIDGKLQGEGSDTLANGDSYEGDYVDTMFQGFGVFKNACCGPNSCPDSCVKRGWWQDGRLQHACASREACQKIVKLENLVRKAERELRCDDAQKLDQELKALARGVLDYASCARERQFNQTLKSSDPQEMYLAAGRYESDGERGRAKAVYRRIVDRFPKHGMAIKATDRLTRLADVESVEASNQNAINRMEDAQREARSASYNQCLNRYSACQSSCDGLRDSSSRNSCRSGCASCSR